MTSKGSDQTARMRRLIWGFAGHNYHIVGNLMHWLNLFLISVFMVCINKTSFIRSRLIWIYIACKCVSKFTWCLNLPDFTLLVLIKRRPSQFSCFVENKYRHEHVMIINLYVISHILYDCHLYECILWGLCTCLREAFGCTPPPCGIHCYCSTS